MLPALLLLTGLIACRAAQEEPASPPNVVIILADDMGYGDPGAYNADSGIPTPYMDRIAAEGMRFTDVHTPSAVCTPTRYALLTGRYSWRSALKRGVLNGYSPLLVEPSRLTLAGFMQQNGYYSAGVGKWHLGLGDRERTDYAQPLRPGPLDVGFDTYFGIPASLDMVPYVFFEDDRVEALPTDSIGPGAPDYREGGPFWRGGPIAPGFRHQDVLPRLTERAVELILDPEGRRSGKPLFLYLALSAPHTPWVPTAEFLGKSAAGEYGDFTVMVDWTIGQVVEALDRAGLSENTLLIVTSDNGSYWPENWKGRWNHASNGAWRGMKADIWEGGHRVPFLVRWPGRVAPGSISDETGSLVDLFATIASATGFSLPEDLAEDSHDLTPVLLGRNLERPIREATVMHSSQGLFAIRQGPWKLVEGLGSGGFTEPVRVEPEPGGPQGQLHRLDEDPGETVNVYQEHPEVVARLQALLDRIRSEGRSRPR